ncbi:MAG: hypothetical protein ACK5BN_15740, partial [Planctomycetota bacterium]
MALAAVAVAAAPAAALAARAAIATVLATLAMLLAALLLAAAVLVPLLLVTRLLVPLLLETLRAALALALRLLVALRRGLWPRRLPAGVRRRSAWMLTAVARLVAVVAATAAAAAPPPAPPAAVALRARAAVWLRLVVARLALAVRMRVGRRGVGFGFVVAGVAGAVGRERAPAAAVGFGVHRFL